MPYEKAHHKPSGPGDARPTALDIIQDEKLVGKLSGKTVLITGATGGLGAEAARALATTGAKIFTTGRNLSKGEEVAKSLTTSASTPVEMIEMELDSFASIRAGAAEFLKRSQNLNILICNAGVMAYTLKNSSTPDFASRVVTLSSCAHRGSGIRFDDINFDKETYDPMIAYAQPKTADLYLATEIEHRFSKNGIHGLALHPGFIRTGLERHIEDSEQGKQFMENPDALHMWKSPEQGAATVVWAAVGKEWEGKGGVYLEDVSEGKPFDEENGKPAYGPGYAKFAYDQEAAGRLWEHSLVMIDGDGS